MNQHNEVQDVNDKAHDDGCHKILQGCRNHNHTFKFYNKDCIVGMAQHIEEKSVDVVVTSPPYNIGVKYDTYKDNLEETEYLKWMERSGIEIKKVLKDTGSFFLNIGNKSTDPWKAFSVAQVLGKHFMLQNVIIWVKSISFEKEDIGKSNILEGSSIGHFKPVNSETYLTNCHEFIFHFTKKRDIKLNKLAIGVPYQDKSNIGRWKSATEDKRDRGNVWFIPYETIQSKSERGYHPSPFPVKLPEMCIKLHGINDNLTVLDPFCGIGSTAVACKRLGISSFVGFDTNPKYIEVAKSRIANCGRQQQLTLDDDELANLIVKSNSNYGKGK